LHKCKKLSDNKLESDNDSNFSSWSHWSSSTG
jgi:hypothetical protein